MIRDFTLGKYRELCHTLLESGYTIITVGCYLEVPGNCDRKIVILRHDVDRKIKNAFRIAKLEHSLGIHSTFYFRYPYTFRPEIIGAIRDMGHEIGYHYETLSKAKGDLKKAITLFECELRSLRTVAEIHTICMHGSPLSKFDNRDLWKNYDFHELGIIGEAYLSIEGTAYFTDTGRNWSGKHSLRDRMSVSDTDLPLAETTDELIAYIRSGTRYPLYLTVHPERWAASNPEWVLGMLMDGTMNTGKAILSHFRK